MDEHINQVDVDNTENHEDGDGATTEEVTNQDELAKLQKIAEDQRIRAEKAEAKLKGLSKNQQLDPEELTKQIEARLRQSQEEEYLSEKNYPDEIAEEIKTLAQVKGLSVRKVESLPYIQSLIQENERAQRVANASANSTGGTTSYKFDPSTPPDVDVSTPEGQAAIEEWERKLERYHEKK